MGKSVQQPRFEVSVSGISISWEDWKQSLQAPLSELPELNTEQKEVVQKFGITEEEYKRGHLAGIYGQKRMERRGIELGMVVEQILEGLGAGYELKTVVTEMTKGRWVVRVQTPQQVVNVAIGRELADDIVDSKTVQDQERLRRLLLSSLGRGEMFGQQ